MRRTECFEWLVRALALYAQDRVVPARFCLYVLIDIHAHKPRFTSSDGQSASEWDCTKNDSGGSGQAVAPDALGTFWCAPNTVCLIVKMTFLHMENSTRFFCVGMKPESDIDVNVRPTGMVLVQYRKKLVEYSYCIYCTFNPVWCNG